MLTGSIQHFQSSICEAWQLKVGAQLADRNRFRGAQFLDVIGSLQLLFSSHLRERDKMLLRSILSGGAWNGFLLEKARNEDVRCRFCGDGHLFWDCTFSHLVHVWELPEFMLLITRDRSTWPRCLLWHGWLPCLSTAGERDPSAACVGQLAHRSLEQIVGAYPADASGFWTPPDLVDSD